MVPETPSEMSQIFGIDQGPDRDWGGIHHVPPEAPKRPRPSESAEPTDAPKAEADGEQKDGSVELLREIRDKLSSMEQTIESAVTALETLPDTLRELLGYGE